MVYRIGWPFWRLALKLGCKMSYRYDVFYDSECKRFVGVSKDIKGLVAEGDTKAEVMDSMETGARDMVLYLTRKP